MVISQLIGVTLTDNGRVASSSVLMPLESARTDQITRIKALAGGGDVWPKNADEVWLVATVGGIEKKVRQRDWERQRTAVSQAEANRERAATGGDAPADAPKRGRKGKDTAEAPTA